VRPHLTVVVVFLGGLVSGVLVHQLEKYFDDRDRATIKVASNNPTIREFGIVQIRQAEGPTRRRRLREGKGSVLAVTVPAGEYDIRLWVLGEIVLDEERGIEKGTTLRYSDADLRHPPELFPDQDFVEIPAGVFTQGSTDFPQSSPPHEVSLSAFRIRSVPVTACEYASYLAAEGYFQAGDLADDVKLCSVQADGTKPAAGLTWYDANRFCQWLSVKKHRSFRLPTEAEYERAMRVAHPRSKYPWGDSEYDPEKGPVPQANYREYWLRLGLRSDRTPFDTFPPIQGLYDISGNVWEWTSDWYDPKFYGSKTATSRDSQGPAESPLHQRVVRGGSCQDPIEKLSCAYRGGLDPTYRNYNIGFRVVTR
jgi:formylglycine-generating enzyme required for sulfatase activity